MNPALQRIVNISDKTGHTLVAPSFHASSINSLPEAARESAQFFASRMLNHPYHDRLNALDVPQEGSTQKVHFRIGGRKDDDGTPLPSSVFMIKPYYENLDNWDWGNLPLSGWAEMAYQNILKAGGLEHMAMRMHTFPYGGTNLLGIELEPDLHPIGVNLPPEFSQDPWNPDSQTGRTHFPAGIKDDASKLAALDFLLNNQDRSAYNLLMKVGRDGHAKSLLAIDNGLSMQYKESARWAKYMNRDNLFYYLKAPGFRPIFRNNYAGVTKAISGWWKQNKPAIVKEFIHQASGVQNPQLSQHILTSFGDRVNALDTMVDDFDIHGSKPYEDHLAGRVDNVNKPIFHRAGVAMRQPQAHSELPDDMDACPSCGESYDS